MHLRLVQELCPGEAYRTSSQEDKKNSIVISVIPRKSKTFCALSVIPLHLEKTLLKVM